MMGCFPSVLPPELKETLANIKAEAIVTNRRD